MKRMISAVVAVSALATGMVGAQQVYRSQDGVTLPIPVKQVNADYTARAMQAGVEGTVILEAVVLADGTVGDVSVTRSLDQEHGLDDQAVRAMKQWEFRPGRKDDASVAVAVSVEMTFRLRASQ